MTYEVQPESDNAGKVEEVHDELTTEHGSDNVLVTEAEGEVVSVVGDGVGIVDPIEVETHAEA